MRNALASHIDVLTRRHARRRSDPLFSSFDRMTLSSAKLPSGAAWVGRNVIPMRQHARDHKHQRQVHLFRIARQKILCRPGRRAAISGSRLAIDATALYLTGGIDGDIQSSAAAGTARLAHQ